MGAQELLALKASEAIESLYSVKMEPSALQVAATKKGIEGDYTLVVFPLLRVSHTSPQATGEAIGEWVSGNCPEVANYNVVNGFLNFTLSAKFWNETLKEMEKSPDFGTLPPTGKTIMVEFTSPNTNKPLHLGHVRNNLLGSSVSDILKAAGNNVIKATLVNDRGVHICKSMYAWEKRFNGATPQSRHQKGDHLVGDCYVEYAKMEKEDPSVLDDVHKMLVDWENGDPQVRALWKMMNQWVFDGFAQTYKSLGITFDKTYYESQTYLLGKELVKKGLEMGVFVKDPDGSVWCDLTADGLDRKILLRSDGTSVYITQDLGTAERRFNEFHLDSHVYVVGNEQDYHFQVLKLILSKLGFDWAKRIYHLSYGMVELPEGKMKSREGTVVDADDLIEKMYNEAKLTTEASGKLGDMSQEEKSKLYSMIGLGALKYFILKVDPKKTMLFDPKESIDFNGNTGPFIQYTHARIKSILRKAEQEGKKSEVDDGIVLSPKEVRMVKILASYPDKVKEAADSLSPALIANYSYDLAKEFNQYYHDTPILREADDRVLSMRLALISEVAVVLEKAMGLLGISLPERM
ncbi:MAG TPA: arginine--tRNA ligase [Rikenellaceae bacterium]|nr:arginine--tRNA ligase [Rikenellaceae bacterium]